MVLHPQSQFAVSCVLESIIDNMSILDEEKSHSISATLPYTLYIDTAITYLYIIHWHSYKHIYEKSCSGQPVSMYLIRNKRCQLIGAWQYIHTSMKWRNNTSDISTKLFYWLCAIQNVLYNMSVIRLTSKVHGQYLLHTMMITCFWSLRFTFTYILTYVHWTSQSSYKGSDTEFPL